MQYMTKFNEIYKYIYIYTHTHDTCLINEY